MTAVLELDRVTRVYGSGHLAVTALDGVSLRVAAGELVAVMGPAVRVRPPCCTLPAAWTGRPAGGWWWPAATSAGWTPVG